MGNKQGKANAKQKTAVKLSDKDYKYLESQTGLTREQINSKFREFMNNNEDGKLNKSEFSKLYSKMREEPSDKLREISDFVFELFDHDNSGIFIFLKILSFIYKFIHFTFK